MKKLHHIVLSFVCLSILISSCIKDDDSVAIDCNDYHGAYTYNGSLTTPGCFEIVTWLVLKTPVEASEMQILRMHDIIHNNYRPIQLLNEREITAYN